MKPIAWGIRGYRWIKKEAAKSFDERLLFTKIIIINSSNFYFHNKEFDCIVGCFFLLLKCFVKLYFAFTFYLDY